MDTKHGRYASFITMRSALAFALLLLVGTGCGGDTMESVTYTADNAPVVYHSLPDSATVHQRNAVDEGPEIDGGNDAIINAIDYPSDAFDDGVEGQVLVSFVVGPDGLIYEPDVLSSVSPSIDREALRVLQDVDWISGRSNGEAVYVKMELPVPFRLSEHQPADSDNEAPGQPQPQPQPNPRPQPQPPQR